MAGGNPGFLVFGGFEAGLFWASGSACPPALIGGGGDPGKASGSDDIEPPAGGRGQGWPQGDSGGGERGWGQALRFGCFVDSPPQRRGDGETAVGRGGGWPEMRGGEDWPAGVLAG